jgi:hypothetical protein
MSWFSDTTKETLGISIPTPTLPFLSSVAAQIRPQHALNGLEEALRDPVEWAQERERVLDRWRLERMQSLARWAEEHTQLLMEPPTQDVYFEVNPGGYSGNPAYLVNGVKTSLEDARDKYAIFLSRLLQRPVRLLYNPTELFGVRDFAQCLLDKLWMPPAPQHNQTTKQLTYLLYHAKGPIALVTHSQGSLITQNALITLDWLGKGAWIRDQLAWLSCGAPIWQPWIPPRMYGHHTKDGDFTRDDDSEMAYEIWRDLYLAVGGSCSPAARPSASARGHRSCGMD